MNASQVRQAYLDHYKKLDHVIIPRASLVPLNDPTTLFTGSGMQPLIPFLLGEKHPAGQRLVDSQTCLRAQDIDDIGDNRHTTFFEMLGNWSLGDYYKKEQMPWIFSFLVDTIGLDPNRIYVTCCSGFPEYGIGKDNESEAIWKDEFKKRGIEATSADIGSEERGAQLGDMGARIFFYDEKNWWSRNGAPKDVKVGEPCGPDTEMFYLFPQVEHDTKFGAKCHPNCDCGRYIELGNSVFMEYKKTDAGFEPLPNKNVDYGGGLERIAAALLDTPDVFEISILRPIIDHIEAISGKKYTDEQTSMRIIADHLRATMFLAVDGVHPSNKGQGYLMRRLLRRAILKAFNLGIEQHFLEELTPVITGLFRDDYPEVAVAEADVVQILVKEEKAFRQTLRKGLREFEKLAENGLTGAEVFMLYDTYGFPTELSIEEAEKQGIAIDADWQAQFEQHMESQRQRSQTAAKGTFKGGLGGSTMQHKRYHTATHLMYQALRDVLGAHVVQRGSNITEERLRFDFSHPQKVTPEEIAQIEAIVNREIAKDLKISWAEYPTAEATGPLGALGQFGDRYGDTVKVYSMQADDANKPFSFEICGGPHVDHTLQLLEEAKTFKIVKEEASSAGIRRIKAKLI